MTQRAQTMVELADELEKYPALPFHALPNCKLKFIAGFAMTERQRDMIVAALRSTPAPGGIEAREALEPFARTAANYDASLARTNQAAADEAKCTGGEYTAKSPIPDAHRVSVTMGDCRKAQRALAALRSAPAPGGIEEDALTTFLCDAQDRIGPGCDERAIAQALLSTYALQPMQPGQKGVQDYAFLEQAHRDSDWLSLSASEKACYDWPDDTDLHKQCRAAYVAGATDYALPQSQPVQPAGKGGLLEAFQKIQELCDGNPETVHSICGQMIDKLAVRPDAPVGVRAAVIEECAKCIPTSWLDPLLSGANRIRNLPTSETEQLLQALAARIRILALPSAPVRGDSSDARPQAPANARENGDG